jgi:hypothetical protein
MISIALVSAAVMGEAFAVSQTKITDVRISEDLRRVVIKADGPIDCEPAHRLEGASRLAILIPDTTLGDVDRTVRNPDSRELLVYVSSSASGVKIVLDFGKAGVPAFKIKVMDNCLMALLGPSGSHAAASQDRSFSSAAGSSVPPKATLANHHADIPKAFQPGEDLIIRSADVVDGMVVLQVASKKNGGRTYKVKLGLNLENLGFNSAIITRMRDEGLTSQRAPKPPAVASTRPAANRRNPQFAGTPPSSNQRLAQRTPQQHGTNPPAFRTAESHVRRTSNTEARGPVSQTYRPPSQNAQWMSRY